MLDQTLLIHEPLVRWDGRERQADYSETGAPGLEALSFDAPVVRHHAADGLPTPIRLIGDTESPSLRHLDAPASAVPFRFDATHLERLVRVNQFSAGISAWGGDLVLFGLRGCRLADDPDFFPPSRDLADRLGFATDADRLPDKLPLWAATAGFTRSALLVEDAVTHVLPRCLLGVWRRSTGEFALVRGTTTPNWDYSVAAIRARAGNDAAQGDANLLLPGLYRYQVGAHKSIPDAFRLVDQDHGVVRPASKGKAEICYTTRDRFWWDAPSQDNIHPSMAGWGSAKDYVFHYSAGCQTIQGRFDEATSRHEGAWSVFRHWAGLSTNHVDTAAVGRHFSYVLLTGREAALAATNAPDEAIARLRYGSRGSAVSTLQTALGIHASGHFDGVTQKKFVAWQWTKGLHRESADGVLGPHEGEMLKVRLVR